MLGKGSTLFGLGSTLFGQASTHGLAWNECTAIWAGCGPGSNALRLASTKFGQGSIKFGLGSIKAELGSTTCRVRPDRGPFLADNTQTGPGFDGVWAGLGLGLGSTKLGSTLAGLKQVWAGSGFVVGWVRSSLSWVRPNLGWARPCVLRWFLANSRQPLLEPTKCGLRSTSFGLDSELDSTIVLCFTPTSVRRQRQGACIVHSGAQRRFRTVFKPEPPFRTSSSLFRPPHHGSSVGPRSWRPPRTRLRPCRESKQQSPTSRSRC